MHLSRRTYVPLFLQAVKYVVYIFQSHQSRSGSVYTRKNAINTSFRIYEDRLIWKLKDISKLPGEKGHAYHPEQILDDVFSTIHGLSNLAANMSSLPSTDSPPWPQTENIK